MVFWTDPYCRHHVHPVGRDHLDPHTAEPVWAGVGLLYSGRAVVPDLLVSRAFAREHVVWLRSRHQPTFAYASGAACTGVFRGSADFRFPLLIPYSPDLCFADIRAANGG